MKISSRAAIIPARSGSKGLPGKNLRLLAGRPLIWYTIKAALEAASISRVIVSTDDKRIAEYATSLGAESVIHPSHLSLDGAPTVGVVQWNANRLAHDGISELVVMRATSPLRTAADTQGAILAYDQREDADSLVSVNFVPALHPVRIKRITDDGMLKDAYEPEGYYPIQRQRLEEFCIRNGAIYIVSVQLAQEQKLWGDQCLAYVMEPLRSVNINTESDFRIAELLLIDRSRV